jgi:predicted CopG family antitoxin
MKKQTTIQISEKTWTNLTKIKRLGETFDSIINRLLIECVDKRDLK